MTSLDWDRADRREVSGRIAAENRASTYKRRRAAHPEQHAAIRELSEELGREVVYPHMAYDARVLLHQLRMQADTRKRMQRGNDVPD